MTNLSEQNLKNIEQLKWFCNQDKIYGWCSNVWFNSLVTRYPWHYLIFKKDAEDGDDTKKMD